MNETSTKDYNCKKNIVFQLPYPVSPNFKKQIPVWPSNSIRPPKTPTKILFHCLTRLTKLQPFFGWLKKLDPLSVIKFNPNHQKHLTKFSFPEQLSLTKLKSKIYNHPPDDQTNTTPSRAPNIIWPSKRPEHFSPPNDLLFQNKSNIQNTTNQSEPTTIPQKIPRDIIIGAKNLGKESKMESRTTNHSTSTKSKEDG